MAWDSEKLDALLVEIEEQVHEGLEREDQISEEDSVARIIGFWMYKFRECKD